MAKRGWLGCLSVCFLLAAVVVACVPALHWGLFGLLWGEHFYRGRPATSWDVQLSSDLDICYREAGRKYAPVDPLHKTFWR
jgi:hypothetical protein